MKLIANVNPDYAGVTYKQDEWEIPRENVRKLINLVIKCKILIKKLKCCNMLMKKMKNLIENCSKNAIFHQKISIKTNPY